MSLDTKTLQSTVNQGRSRLLLPEEEESKKNKLLS